ncbi:MAG TPA: YncE family protein [Bacteroidia bacterium]|nr:YncE family protein [Bacteroidia bacterium]
MVETSGFPNAVGKIILTRCAVTGCHNTASAPNAAGLDLTSWNSMFAGDRSGNSVTIPYSHRFSTSFLFTNTYPDLGVSTPPTIMPFNSVKLTHDEEVILRSWIDDGAPDRNGFVKFSDNPNRKKVYVLNSGCDVVTVFDEATGLPMRFIPVGLGNSQDFPHVIKVSPDGNYWMVVFLNYPYMQVFRTSDDSYIGQAYLTSGGYTAITFSPDSKNVFVLDIDGGKIDEIELPSLTVLDTLHCGAGPGLHGMVMNPSGNALYATNQIGNTVYKFYPSPDSLGSPLSIPVDGTKNGTSIPVTAPHDILFSGSSYYVTLQVSDQVAVMDARKDSLLKLIHVGATPQEMAVSPSRHLLFVTCQDDSTTLPGKRGSVYVIDLLTNTVKATLAPGWQPNGLAVDEAKGLVYVANRNASANGPAPHHTTDCGGRNGFVTMIDMNTLQLVPAIKVEMASNPYSVSIRN